MKKNIFYSLGCILFLFSTCFGQVIRNQGDLYLISGSTSEAYNDYYFKSYLLRYKSMIEIDTIKIISNEKESLDFLKIYNDLGFILYQKDQNLYQRDTKYLYKLDFNNLNITDSIKLDIGNNSVIGILPSSMLFKKNDTLNYVYDLINKKQSKSHKNLGININNWSKLFEKEDSYKYCYTIGSPAIGLDVSEACSFIIDTLGQVRLPVTYDFSKRPVLTNYVFNNKFTFPFKRGGIEINTDYFTLFIPSAIKKVNKDITEKENVILSKVNKEIFNWKEVGKNNLHRCFKEWLTGVVLNRTIESSYKTSIGVESRKKEQLETGLSLDFKTLKNNQIFEGKLFLFNTTTKKYIEIDTKQGDSEIILVEKEIVYYRVFDELYMGTIGNTKIENVTKIIKHPLIQDAHWAFIAK